MNTKPYDMYKVKLAHADDSAFVPIPSLCAAGPKGAAMNFANIIIGLMPNDTKEMQVHVELESDDTIRETYTVACFNTTTFYALSTP